MSKYIQYPVHVQQSTVSHWWRIDMKSFIAAIQERITEFEAVKDIKPQPITFGSGLVIGWRDPALEKLDEIEAIADWYIDNAENEPCNDPSNREYDPVGT